MALLKSFGSLAALHAATLLLPLVLYPYLSRILGVEGFGELVVSQAVVQYFVLLVDFGFGLSATRDAAQAGGDVQKVNQIFWAVTRAKALFVACSLLVCLLIWRWIDNALLIKLVLLQFPVVIGAWLFPLWLYQAREKLPTATLITFGSKAIAIPVVLFFVSEPGDVFLAAIAFGLGGAVLACAGLLARTSLGVTHSTPFRAREIKLKIQESWPLFLSSAGVSLYTTINIILLRLVTGADQVGYFAAADKLRGAAMALLPIMTNVMFPSAARQALGPALPSSLGAHLRHYWPNLFLGLCVFVGLVLTAPFVVPLLFGPAMADASLVLQIMAATALVVPISMVVGVQHFVARNQSHYFTYAVLGAGLLNIVLLPLLGHWYAARGAAVSLVLTESAIAMALVGFFFKTRDKRAHAPFN